MRLVSASAGARAGAVPRRAAPRWRLAGAAPPQRAARATVARGGMMKPRLLPATRTSASGKSSDARYGRRRTRVIHRATARRRSRARGARGTRDPPAEARLDGTPSPSANGRSSGTPCPISSPTSTRRRSRRGAARGSTTTYRPPRRRRVKHAVFRYLMTRRRIGIGRTSGAAACWRAWNGATRRRHRARTRAVRARVNGRD